jgi:hypothetical protein
MKLLDVTLTLGNTLIFVSAVLHQLRIKYQSLTDLIYRGKTYQMTDREKAVIFAARRLYIDDNWPNTSERGMLRRLGFHDVASAIAHLQTAVRLLNEERRAKGKGC